MEKFLAITQVTFAILLAGVILLQQRGTGLGGAFGSDGNIYRSRRGAERLLFITTIVIACLFGLSAIINLFLH